MGAKPLTIEQINNRIPKDSILQAIEYAGRHKSNAGLYKSIVKCKCQCGNIKDCILTDLMRGNPLSCGCKKKPKNALAILFKRWVDMRNRCYNKQYKIYQNYGAKGVRVCDEWLNDFEAFKQWSIDNGYSPELQLDKDIRGNGLLYSPDTCKWATVLENASNKKNSVKYEYKGRQMTIPEISRETDILQSVLKERVKKGMTIQEAIEYVKLPKFTIYSND